MKVEADRDVCIGAGMCVMTDETVFDQDDDGIVVVVEPEVGAAHERLVGDAVKLCPSAALRIVAE